MLSGLCGYAGDADHAGRTGGKSIGDLPGVYEVLWYGGAAAGLLPLWGSAASGKNEPIGAAMGSVFGGSGGGDCGRIGFQRAGSVV